MLAVIGFLPEIYILQPIRIFGIFIITTFGKTAYGHIMTNTIIFTMPRGLL